jgi:hypothetical protein
MTAPILDKVFFGNFSSHPILYIGLILALFVLNEATTSFQFWFLGYWSSQYLDHPASSVPVPLYAHLIFCVQYRFNSFIIQLFGHLQPVRSSAACQVFWRWCFISSPTSFTLLA